MPKRIVPLTDMRVKKAKPQKKAVMLFDGDGLYLLVAPSGGKLWRLKYRFENKEHRLAPGDLSGNFPCRCQTAAGGGPETDCPRDRPRRRPEGPEAGRCRGGGDL